ncbi:hypothetical protein Tco_1250831, partial [Tanacetum coccineum]
EAVGSGLRGSTILPAAPFNRDTSVAETVINHGEEDDQEDTHEIDDAQTETDTSDDELEENIGSTSQGKTITRKETRALGEIRKSCLNKKNLAFEVDDCSGRIVGDDSQRFITKGGCVMRKFAKLDGTTWKATIKLLNVTNSDVSGCVDCYFAILSREEHEEFSEFAGSEEILQLRYQTSFLNKQLLLPCLLLLLAYCSCLLTAPACLLLFLLLVLLAAATCRQTYP